MVAAVVAAPVETILPDGLPVVGLPGRSPALAANGAQVIAVWEDERREALRGRLERSSPPAEYWWGRLTPDGPLPDPQGRFACTAPSGRSLTVAADESKGVGYLLWLQPAAANAQIRGAVLEADGGTTCLAAPLFLAGFDAVELAATYPDGQLLVAWREGTKVRGNFCTPPVPCPLPVDLAPSVVSAAKSFGLGKRGTSAILAVRDASNQAWVWTPTPTMTPTWLLLEPNALGLAVDPVDGVVAVKTSLNTFKVISPSLTWTVSALNAPVPLLASLSPGKTVLSIEEHANARLRQYLGDGGVASVPSPAAFFDAALTSDGDAGRAAYRDGQALKTMRLVPRAGVLNSDPSTGLIQVPAPLRRPSVVWRTDHFLIAYEEWKSQGWEPRLAVLHLDGGLGSPPSFVGSLAAPALMAAPDGGVFLRYDVGGTTQAIPVPARGDLAVTGIPAQSTVASEAGAVGYSRIVHWSARQVHFGPILSISTGASRLSSGAAVVPGRIWVPIRDITDAVAVREILDPVQTLGSAVPVATVSDPATPVAITVSEDRSAFLVGWFAGGNLVVRELSATGQPQPSSSAFAAPAGGGRSLALTPFEDGYLAVVADDRELIAQPVSRIAGVTEASTRLNAGLNERPGDPVVATAPNGTVAVVWPAWLNSESTVVLRTTLVEPPRQRTDAGVGVDAGLARDAGLRFDGGLIDGDAGVVPGPDDAGSDAGSSDAGAPDGGTPDAGPPDDGGQRPEDAGLRDDAGVPPDERRTLLFQPTSCGCDGAPGAALVALLALARRRRRA